MNKKNIVIAIVLSTAFIILWYTLAPIFFPQAQPQSSQTSEEQSQNPAATTETQQESETGSMDQSETVDYYTRIKPIAEEDLITLDSTLETDTYLIEYSNKGGLIKNVTLKATPILNNTEVEMILTGNTGEYPFELELGGIDTKDVVFDVEKKSDSNEIIFSKRFAYLEGDEEHSFLLKKTFTFYEDQYIVDLLITIESEQKEALAYLKTDSGMYTLTFGPQIGPEFTKLDGRNEYRRYTYLNEGKRKDFSSKVKQKRQLLDKTASWIALEGKYFIVIAYPPKPFLEPFTLGFDTTPMEEMTDVSQMVFQRPYNRSTIVEDKFKFYIGPKKADILSQYKDRYSFDKAVPGSIWDWLIVILKALLVFLQKIVKNWGVAIILMTIIIKLLVFPLTQKGFKSNTKLQALAPKANEIKEKFKDDPQKMQTEMAALYKKEGINPLGGCLPLLIQMPIFFALYTLLNSHFELRGAVFIPGWINDLSVPETFISLPDAFSVIPVIGNQIRLLPFLMVGTTFFQQRISQNPTNTTGQMKLLIYGMPIFFFVIMYNMPSGLVVYWTMQNFLSVFQQLYINKVVKKGEDSSKGSKGSGGIVEKLKQLTRSKK